MLLAFHLGVNRRLTSAGTLDNLSCTWFQDERFLMSSDTMLSLANLPATAEERGVYTQLFDLAIEERLTGRGGELRPEVLEAVSRYTDEAETKLASSRALLKLLMPTLPEPFSSRQVAIVAVLNEMTVEEVLEIETRLSRLLRESAVDPNASSCEG